MMTASVKHSASLPQRRLAHRLACRKFPAKLVYVARPALLSGKTPNAQAPHSHRAGANARGCQAFTPCTGTLIDARTGRDLSENTANMARVLQIVTMKPGCSTRQLRAVTGVSERCMQRVLTRLLREGRIVSESRGAGRAFYPLGVVS